MALFHHFKIMSVICEYFLKIQFNLAYLESLISFPGDEIIIENIEIVERRIILSVFMVIQSITDVMFLTVMVYQCQVFILHNISNRSQQAFVSINYFPFEM